MTTGTPGQAVTLVVSDGVWTPDVTFHDGYQPDGSFSTTAKRLRLLTDGLG